MSDEVVKEEMNENVMMYVHQIGFDVLKNVLKKVTNVSLTFTYNMPNKVCSYKNSGFDLIRQLDEYANGDESWRITKDKNLQLHINDGKLYVGEWVITETSLVLCIPQINSIIILPDEESTFRGGKEPTKIIQLSNCISVTPLLLVLGDEPDLDNQGKYKLSVGYQIIDNTKTAQ